MSEERNDLPGLGVRRPLLTLVLNLLVALMGVAAVLAVEVRELPDVDRPVVSVTAQYPGASPQTIDAEVTSVIEGAVARVSGVQRIASSSEENTGRVRIEFSPGTDLDTAAADVREAVSRVQRQLPDRIEQLTVVKADDDATPVVRLAAWSEQLDEQALARRLEQDVVPEFISIDGVADVQLFGARPRQLRVMIDPLRLASHGLAVADVAEALRNAPFDAPSGSLRSRDQELIVRAQSRAVSPEAVEQVLVRSTPQGDVRVGDVAQAVFGPQDATSYVRLDGRPVAGLGIVRQAQSNTIRISEGVHESVRRVNQRFPELRVEVTSDDAVFIRSSVREVLVSLALSVAIVVLTIRLFLGSWRATLVPAATIPVALVGTVAAIWAVGFSINLVTLLALVLATGLVVDDAIVVLENIQRRRAQGLGPRAAAVLGTRQVFFAVLATTAVLIAVFVPIAFLPGTAGRLFREFGFVLAIAVALSSFVALSLGPALGSRLLPEVAEPRGLQARLARVGGRAAGGYARLLERVLRRPWLTLLAALAAAGAAAALFTTLDRELVPPEDRGLIQISATGPDGVGLDYVQRQVDRMEAVLQPLRDSGEIESLLTIVGRWDPNRAWISAPLADWDARERSQGEIIDALRGPMSRIAGVTVSVYGSSSLNVGSGRGGITVAITGEDYARLYEVARTFAQRIESGLPGLSNVEISYQPTQPQLSVQIDRRRAAELGVSLDDLALTLRAMVDGEELVDLNIDDEVVPLLLEARPGAVRGPPDLQHLSVRGAGDALVPLSNLATLREEGVAAELDRHAQRRAIELQADLDSGYALQAAVDDLRALAAQVLPPGTDLILLNDAATLEETSRGVGVTVAIALVVVLLVLVAQFENVPSALVVMGVVPFGIAAGIGALALSGVSLNIYSQIGLVMLIGLMAKNGILLVEFADQLRDEGASVRDAVLEAARVRLRPIAMTLLSTVLGGLPLVLASGAGAEARNSIGWVVFGGLALAAVFTLLLTPLLYLGLARLGRPRAHEGERLQQELQQAAERPDAPAGEAR
ncbi:efflux RND transporter permease subunit [Azohydromonas aeria]|uniref:efflux RND transporter permease subunit n=1 Tax=Azohydromonas aeria TaxID=2590212 RepID=UPI0012FCE1E2|nr:efflux RND transporter permease subunit [Azohydromonas aeria]